MDENDKKEVVYLALQDLYKDFNNSVNHILIIREFLADILNIKENKEMVYDFPSIIKYQTKRMNSQKKKCKL